MEHPGDKKLLERFAFEKSQAAFAALVEHHIRLVYSTCYRELGQKELAEDATQAVFIALAGQARSIYSAAALVPWLYSTARHKARDIRRQETRRMARENLAAGESQMQRESQEHVWNTIEPALNDAISALGHADQQAILLRYFDGMTMREVGQAMGTNEDAARKRVSRALEKLRGALAGRRAATVSALALAALLTERAVYSVPAYLSASVAQSAGAVAGVSAPPLLGVGGLRGGSALNPLLAKGLIVMSTYKLIAGVVAAILLLAALIIGVHRVRSDAGAVIFHPNTQAATAIYSVANVATLPADAGDLGHGWRMNGGGDAVGLVNSGGRQRIPYYYHDGNASEIPASDGNNMYTLSTITGDGTIWGWSRPGGWPSGPSQITVLTGTKDGLSTNASLVGTMPFTEVSNRQGVAYGACQTSPNQCTLYSVANGQVSPVQTLACRILLLSGINSTGDIAGTIEANQRHSARQAFVYSGGNLTILPMPAGAVETDAYAISDSGYVVGFSEPSGPGGVDTAWLYHNGSSESLGALPGKQYSIAWAVNNSGIAVGDAFNSEDGPSVAALFENNHATDLNTLIAPGSGIVLQHADSINDSGQILCAGQQNGKPVLVLLAPAK